MAKSSKRLHELHADVLKEVDQRLLSGESPSSVAAWLQDELHQLTDIQPASLKKNLERYRASELKDKVIEKVVAKTLGKHVSGIHSKLNALEEMERLVAVQKARYEKALVKEEASPLPMKMVSDEGRLLKEMLVELGKLQLETGIGLQRAPKRITGAIEDPDGTKREFSWTEEQEKLYQQLDAIPDVDYTKEERRVLPA